MNDKQYQFKSQLQEHFDYAKRDFDTKELFNFISEQKSIRKLKSVISFMTTQQNREYWMYLQNCIDIYKDMDTDGIKKIKDVYLQEVVMCFRIVKDSVHYCQTLIDRRRLERYIKPTGKNKKAVRSL